MRIIAKHNPLAAFELKERIVADAQDKLIEQKTDGPKLEEVIPLEEFIYDHKIIEE